MKRRSTPKPADQYHHGDLRRSLIDAALELIEHEGLEGLSLRAVARRANVSHTAPYHHFADRAALMASLAEEGFIALGGFIERRISGIAEPRLRLIEAGIAYVLFASKHPAHFRVMFSPELAGNLVSAAPSSLRDAAGAAFDRLVASIERCQEEGSARDGDPREYARAAWSLMHGLAMLLLDGHLRRKDQNNGSIEAIARRVTETLWMGLSI